MEINTNTSRILAHTAYVINVVNGGMSMPSTRFNRHNDHYVFQVAVPGVDAELLTVEIHRDGLYIYQLMDLIDTKPIPYLINHMQIPGDVDHRGVRAELHQGKLNVIMPFNELADGYHREVEIVRS